MLDYVSSYQKRLRQLIAYRILNKLKLEHADILLELLCSPQKTFASFTLHKLTTIDIVLK